jgi:hypothetical protein
VTVNSSPEEIVKTINEATELLLLVHDQQLKPGYSVNDCPLRGSHTELLSLMLGANRGDPVMRCRFCGLKIRKET